jgi:hypothetical protein
MRRRYLVTLRDRQHADGLQALGQVRSGLKFHPYSGLSEEWLAPAGEDSTILFETLGVVSLTLSDEERIALGQQSSPDGPVAGIEPDRRLIVIPFEVTGGDKSLERWNLVRTKIDTSPFDGSGILLCVLDCGYDGRHPDFDGRVVAEKSFVGNDPGLDTKEHGTVCLGIACGRPCEVPRYAMAPGCQILVGQVLDDIRGGTTELAAGIVWAVENGAHVISLSVGFETSEPSPVLEHAGAYALDQGCLLVAAAGNNMNLPVIQPANGPSFMAVAGLDVNLARARASSESGRSYGAKIDIGAPSEDIFTSFPLNRKHGTATQGTSLAAPHVAGIAALWAQASMARGRELWQRVIAAADPLALPSSFMGAGNVQAPQADWNISRRVRPRPIIAGQSRLVVFLAHASPSQPEVAALMRDDGFAVLEIDGVDGTKQGAISAGLVERLRQLPGVLSVMVEDHAGKFSPR